MYIYKQIIGFYQSLGMYKLFWDVQFVCINRHRKLGKIHLLS